jgi:hypothetical protein
MLGEVNISEPLSFVHLYECDGAEYFKSLLQKRFSDALRRICVLDEAANCAGDDCWWSLLLV